MQAIDTLKAWARRIKRDAMALWFACRHSDTPWYAKALGAFVLAYALSPIDLIPDFIPVLGLLDDAVLLPALIWLTVRLIPEHVLVAARQQADDWMAAQATRPRSWAGATVIVLLWLAGLWLLVRWLY